MKIPVKIPWIVQALFPRFTWRIPTHEKEVFLTFDDGPIEGMTEWILDELAKRRAKATFFVVGANARKNPHLIRRILDEGHGLGNHTFNHLNGFKTPIQEYVENIRLCEEELKKWIPEYYPRLFRPPYGRLRPQQASIIRQFGYQIVLWDVLSFDFDLSLSPKTCIDNVLNHTRTGSIIVMHDNLKAEPRVYGSLPRILDQLLEKGYQFRSLVSLAST